MSYTLNYTGSEIDDILDRAAPGGALDTAIAAKQDALTFDDAPTEGSDNPVKSGGIYDAIQAGGAAALAAFPTDSVSGDVVSFPDGADGIPVKAFTGSIIPQQDLNGQSAPYPAGGGKNLLPSWENGGTIGSVPIVKQGNGYISINGAVGGFRAHSDAVTLAAGTYTFSALKVSGSVTASIQIDIRKSDGSAYPATLYVSSSTANGSQQKATFTLSASGDYQFSIYASTTLTNLVLGLMVESGSTATAYAPYANICPISGWTGANITRAGKNLFNINATFIKNSANYSVSGDVLTVTSTVNSSASIRAMIMPITSDMVGKSIALSGTIGGTTPQQNKFRLRVYNDAEINSFFADFTSTAGASVGTVTSAMVGKYLAIVFYAPTTSGQSTTYTGVQIEFSDTATAYEAYQADTILLDFGQTVYAGTLTALGGGLWKIQPTHKAVDMGSLSWTYDSGNTRFWSDGVASEIVKPATWGANALCSMFGRATANPPNGYFSIYASGRVYVKATQYTTAAAFTTAVTGQTFLYELATLPDPITITGEDLQTLLGANTVWTDVGSVTELEYRADTALYIQKLIGGGGTLSTLSMAAPAPSLSLGRVGVLAEPEEAEPEQTDEEAEQLEQTEESEQTEEE